MSLEETLARVTKPRVRHDFTLPTGQVVGIVELTIDEEMMAAKRSGNDPMKLAWELAQESFRALDGAKLSTGDGSANRAFADLPPKARALIVTAYQNVNNPPQTELDAFLKSHSIQV